MTRPTMIAAAVLLAGLAGPLPSYARDTPVVAVQAEAIDARLAPILADYEAYLRANDPVTSGLDGDRPALSRLPDLSRAGELARRQPLQSLLARLDAIAPETLNSNDARNQAFVSLLIHRELDGIALDTSRLAFNSEGGISQSVAYFATVTRISTLADAEAWLARLDGTARLFDDTLANARRGVSTGMVQPASVVASALNLARTDVNLSPDTDPLLKPFADLPASIPAERQAALRQQARAIVADDIMPRRRAWLAFLTDEALPAAPTAPGLVHRPGGRELYAYFVRGYTTTDLTPDQVHQIGVEEVARIRARMDTEMRAAGWTGDFAGFLAFLRSDPQFYATSREDLLEKASEMAKRADDHLPGLFGTLPRLTYGVRPVPRAIEDSYTTGRYNGGSMKSGIAGGYMVNTSHLDQRPLYELPALTLHEAVPGHHLQIALQQEAEDQPYFRRGADVTAFVEGWGLYSEFLGEEMGFYRTPYERFGRLSYEMWRACRLVADTGLHWMGWTTEQARACFRDNSALAPLNIETELQRYIGWPGQATAYKIGEIRLRAVRARAEAALGDRFDIRAFHDALLVDGPLPLDLLDARMDAWIAGQAVR
ncbi:DUF885 family protein [uncultured Brevundimonas sp.]|uniref:DUF885 domain-containing protein n=1 Tax=uncultured Brevundimonas sp. TaxID=213418 RepID=UPI0030EB1CC0